MLSEGQRIVLRASRTKLRKLESEFEGLDPEKHPKMLVVCEDTTVTPLVDEFMRLQGLANDDVLHDDSNRKGELKAEEWKLLQERLFDVDRHKALQLLHRMAEGRAHDIEPQGGRPKAELIGTGDECGQIGKVTARHC
jgi:type III restriction enzyme